MTWVRLDDGYFRHPKIRAIGRDGRALHLASMCWSAANLTDGVIRRSDLPLLLAEADVKKSAVAVLVAEGAWVEHPDGWEIKNFLTYNRAAEEVEAERAEARERMRRARENKRARSPEHRPNFGESSGNPDPTRPDPTPTDVLKSSDDDDYAVPGESSSSSDYDHAINLVVASLASAAGKATHRGWIASTRANQERENGPAIRAALDQGATPAQAADRILHPATPAAEALRGAWT